MTFEKNFKFSLTILLLLAILVYHLFEFYPINDFNCLFGIKNGEKSVYSIVRILISTLFFFLTTSISFISRILNWKRFIGGKYHGVVKHTNELQFYIDVTIEQNLLTTEISGVIYSPDPKYIFSGKMINSDTSKRKFILEMENQNYMKYGLLTLTFENNVGYGFIYETNDENNFGYIVNIKKIDNYLIRKFNQIFKKDKEEKKSVIDSKNENKNA